MKILTSLIILIFIISISYLIKKIFFRRKKNEDRVFEGEFEEIDDKED